jgi:hypothetical protein
MAEQGYAKWKGHWIPRGAKVEPSTWRHHGAPSCTLEHMTRDTDITAIRCGTCGANMRVESRRDLAEFQDSHDEEHAEDASYTLTAAVSRGHHQIEL